MSALRGGARSAAKGGVSSSAPWKGSDLQRVRFPPGISVDLDGEPDMVASSYWAEPGKLMVQLESGVEVAPERLILRSN